MTRAEAEAEIARAREALAVAGIDCGLDLLARSPAARESGWHVIVHLTNFDADSHRAAAVLHDARILCDWRVARDDSKLTEQERFAMRKKTYEDAQRRAREAEDALADTPVTISVTLPVRAWRAFSAIRRELEEEANDGRLGVLSMSDVGSRKISGQKSPATLGVQTYVEIVEAVRAKGLLS